MRGLVRVDAGVLDDHPGPGAAGRGGAASVREQLAGERAAVQEEVHVAAARDLGPHDAGQRRAARSPASPRSRAACGAACLARSKGAVSARSPISGRGGYWNDASPNSAPSSRRTTSLTAPARRAWKSRIMSVAPKPPIIPVRGGPRFTAEHAENAENHSRTSVSSALSAVNLGLKQDLQPRTAAAARSRSPRGQPGRRDDPEARAAHGRRAAASGKPKFGWLKMLNASARSSTVAPADACLLQDRQVRVVERRAP